MAYPSGGRLAREPLPKYPAVRCRTCRHAGPSGLYGTSGVYGSCALTPPRGTAPYGVNGYTLVILDSYWCSHHQGVSVKTNS